MAEQSDRLRELVAEVAAAYFSNSHVSQNDLGAVIREIAASLSAVGETPAVAEPAAVEIEQPKLTPAQIRKSITNDALISFEDGKGYKTLRRHLTSRGLTPEQYREKWGLPADYPVTSPSYSAARSQMAKSRGLGQLRRKAAPALAKEAAAAAPAAKRGRGRPRGKAAPGA
ncbi:MAG: MucR family transcriptional regulator [Caulobacterales bacterium]|nr:MucR family transcriptional regulator [Caulobacterales bacterium]